MDSAEKQAQRPFDMTVGEFLTIWSNKPISAGVLSKGCHILDEAEQYEPEAVVHQIVLRTVQMWADNYDRR